jgi:hypothetical protein
MSSAVRTARCYPCMPVELIAFLALAYSKYPASMLGIAEMQGTDGPLVAISLTNATQLSRSEDAQPRKRCLGRVQAIRLALL